MRKFEVFAIGRPANKATTPLEDFVLVYHVVVLENIASFGDRDCFAQAFDTQRRYTQTWRVCDHLKCMTYEALDLIVVRFLYVAEDALICRIQGRREFLKSRSSCPIVQKPAQVIQLTSDPPEPDGYLSSLIESACGGVLTFLWHL